MRRRLTFCAVLVVALLATGGRVAGAAAHQAETAEALFAEAEGFLQLGRLNDARTGYERIVAEFGAAAGPTVSWGAAARVRLGDLHWRSGALALAGGEYMRVLEQEPPSVWTSRARLGLAAVALVDGDWVSAAELLQWIINATEGGRPDGDEGAAIEARQRLGLIQRFKLQPRRGEPYWSAASVVATLDHELRRPIALATSGDGQLLVVDEGIAAVLLIMSDSSRVSRLPYDDHRRPWWGFDGLPYLPTRKAGVIALGGSQLRFAANEAGRRVPLEDLQSGARTPGGVWYLLDGDPRRVLRFGPDGGFERRVTALDEEIVDLAVDGRGRLLVLDRRLGRVIRFTADGQRDEVVVEGDWRRPEAIEIDGLGNIYVLDRDAKLIDVFDAEGNPLTRLGPDFPSAVQMRSPRDLAVDGTGRVYIADRGAAIVYVIR
ncbi:MAG TPA: hypothetical protein QGG47_11360 [Acidobacteriota bacterium]|nr:hypothetical protein [Acidobacteriota bacterium]